MASAVEMEAFFAATKAQPQSEAELLTVLEELPRRELQALSKSHGVKATLKRESLVEMLVRVLKAKLWPSTAAAAEEKEKEVEATGGVTAETTVETETVEETTSSAVAVVETKVKVDETATTSKKVTVASVAVVGKKTATQRKAKSAASPTGKLKRATPVKVKAMTPSKAMDKIHAKRTAKQMTLQEHEQAKKQRAAQLLSGSKYSVVKKTRSKIKELAEEAVNDKSVAKTLSFGGPAKKTTPAKKAPASVTAKAATKTVAKKAVTAKPTTAKSPVAKPATVELAASKGSTSADDKKAKPVNYKPYVGPLPVFEGDSLFSPKKVEPRPAPMAVSVMKASRSTTPKKVTGAPTKKKPATPVKKATLTKKSPPKKTASSGKENKTPTASAATAKTVTATKSRVTVRATATKVIAVDAKKQERRTKFAQETMAKSTATRQQARTKTTKTTIAITVAST